jgi:hypothetical protein
MMKRLMQFASSQPKIFHLLGLAFMPSGQQKTILLVIGAAR